MYKIPQRIRRVIALMLAIILCMGMLLTEMVAEATVAPLSAENTAAPSSEEPVSAAPSSEEPVSAAQQSERSDEEAAEDITSGASGEKGIYSIDPDAVEAIKVAIDALPEVAYVQGLDIDADADELDAVLSDLSDTEELISDTEDDLTDEQIAEFEEAIGADRMAKYNALYTYFLNMTAPAVPLGSYAPGTIHLSVETGGLPQTATTYNLQTDTSGIYRLRYVPDSTTGTDNTVLVVRWMEYGSTIETLPNASAVGIEEVIRLGFNSIAIKLTNTLKDDFILDIKLKTAALTQEQAEKWMDNNGMTPMPVISVSEYQWPDDLAEFTETGRPYNTVDYGSVVPAVSDCSIDVTHTYKFDVSSVGPITNYMLDKAGTYMGNYGYLCSWNQNGMLRYTIPTVHSKGDNRLLEIKSIKIYCPDEKLELIGLGKSTSTSDNGKVSAPSLGRDLGLGDFYKYGIWDQWTVGARQTDSSDPGNVKSYYEISPKTRFFNIGDSQHLDAEFYGVQLKWRLIDANDNGTYEADEELLYSDASYTTMQAANTEVTYRCVGDLADSIFKHKGPMIQTFKRENTDVFTNAYSPSRHKDNTSLNEVTIDSEYAYKDTREVFTYTSNVWYIKSLTSKPKINDSKTEYVPTYDGAVTQRFDFPLEIYPRTIHIYDYAQTFLAGTAGRKTVLRELTYTLENGETVSAPQTQINAINKKFAAATTATVSHSYIFANATPQNPVRRVTIIWDNIKTPYRIAYPQSFPVTNVIKNGANTKDGTPYTVGIAFDYHTGEYLDLEKTQPIPANHMARVAYTLTRADVTDDESNPNYLYFRFRQPPCPDLYGAATSDRTTPKYGDGTSTYSIGKIGFYIDRYGKRADDVQDPVIDLTAKSTKFTGIKEAQGLAFLTGEFTAMPKLSGWKIDYTTNKGKDGSIKVQDITDEKGESFCIPLDDDDAFTSIKLSYDGIVNLPHKNETDQTTYIGLMSDIKLRALNKNPIDGVDINTEKNFTSGTVKIDGVLHTGNCSCPDAKHTKTDSNTGQAMVLSSNVPLQRLLYFTRQAVVNFSKAGISDNPSAIYQGNSVVATLTPTVTLDKANPGYSFEGSLFPWGIAEAAYIELPDDEFLPDLSKTTFYGEAATSEHVKAEIKYVGTRRFLKLSFEEGYIRSNVYKANTCDLYGSNSNKYGWTAERGSFKKDNNNTQLAGPIEIAFSTLSSTSLGDHHPLNKVYLDFSGLLDRYDVPNDKGYDGIPTDYIFTNAVEDTLGLSDSEAKEKKLFEFDASKFKVKVMLTATFAVAIVPGKQGSIYAFDTRLTQFEASDRRNLNALVVMDVPQSREAHEMTAYVKIPNKAYPVKWEQSGGVTQESQSQYNMWLLREPQKYSSSGIIGNIKYAYTTDAIPTESSNYTETKPITEDEWKAVTGVRIICEKLSAESSLSIKFDFATDVKDKLGDISACTGGTYKYHLEADATEWVRGYLPLATWKYTDQTIKGGVYWDLYDENGLKGTTGNTGVSYEPWAAGVKAQLFSPADELISETQTGTDGKFVLKSYTDEEGQYIQLTMPEVPNATVKPTKKSIKVFTMDDLDSDFDREKNRLTLPALPTGGFSNISAGLVKLPDIITKEEVTLKVGDRLTLTATLNPYDFKTPLPADSYNITFEPLANTTIATVTGQTIKFTVKPSGGYIGTTTVEGKAVGTTTARVFTTNTLKDVVEKIVKIKVTTSFNDVKVKKVWDDGDNEFGTRPSPSSVTLQLKRMIPGGTPENVGSPVTISDTSHTFTDQPVFNDAGDKYEYSVTETNVPLNYEVIYSNDITTGELVVTNKLKTITVSGVKTWDERGESGYIRPASIQVSLLRDGVAMTPAANYTKTVTAAYAVPANPDKWEYKFEGLLEYNPTTGQKYVYTVLETPFTANNPGDPGFNYSAVADGMNVTNMYPVKRFYKVTKNWDYGGLPSDLWPTGVTIKLYRDGDHFTEELTCRGTKTLNAANDWTHTFEVKREDAQGHTFNIVEVPIDGYTMQKGAFVLDTVDTTRGSWTVTNKYTPKPVKYNPSVTKAISGPLPTDATAKEFEFKLTSMKAGQPMPAGASGNTLTANITGIGTLNFGDITFSKAGTYTYKIQEIDRSGQPGYDGYSFDTTVYTLTVKVEDKTGDGTLKTTSVVIKDDTLGAEKSSPLTVTNTYKPNSTSYTLKVNKELTGDTPILGDSFKFTLTPNDAANPMPAGSGNTVTINGEGNGSFGSIEFTKTGEYAYTIKEDIPADANKVEGYTYSTKAVTVKITVKDVNGQLQATANVANEDIKITNKFTTPKIDVTGGISWPGWSAGDPLPTTTVCLWQNNPNPTASDNPYAESDISAGGTSYRFTGLPKYDERGIPYSYTVSEMPIIGTDITLAANGRDFQNRKRTLARITSNELNIIKTISGNSMLNAERFTFTIERTDPGLAEAVIMPGDRTATTAPIRTGSAPAVGFGDIAFCEAGTYTFTVTENASGIDGMTDDISQKDVTVEVVNNSSVLTATITDSASGGTLNFTNTYRPLIAEEPGVSKLITGDTPVRAETFTFELAAQSYTAPDGTGTTMTADQMPMPQDSVNGVKTVSRNGAGNVEFGKYIYTQAGEYIYTIRELAGTNADYTYDETQYTLTDTVTEDDGVLKCVRTITKPDDADNSEPTFTNVYTLPPVTPGGGGGSGGFGGGGGSGGSGGDSGSGGSGSAGDGESAETLAPENPETPTTAATGELTISTQVTGDLANRDKEFTFVVTFSDDGEYEYTGSKSGTLKSGDSIPLSHGQSITITKLPAGISYSVIVKDNDGYSTSTFGDMGTIFGANTRMAIFTNSRSSVPKTGDDNRTMKYLLLTLISLLGLLISIWIGRTPYRKRKEDAGE